MKASGRRVSFHHGFESLADLVHRDDPRRWAQGLILIGEAQEVAQYIEMPQQQLAGPPSPVGLLAAVRARGVPAILVSDTDTVRAGRMLASSLLPALRGVSLATIGEAARPKATATRVTLDELELAPAVAEVFGRADITFAVATRTLPAGTKPSRLALDLMIAPDAAGEKAVVSVFVADRLLGSAVAAVGEPTKFDLALPEGLVGTVLKLRPRGGATPQRPGRLPLRTARLPGAGAGLERDRADRRGREAARFRRSLGLVGQRHRGLAAVARARAAGADDGPRRRYAGCAHA